MQALDSSTLKKCSGNEASSINFRPSPNFKHMKKYLKSKFEEDQNAGMNDKTEQKNKVISGVQPPLPPNSPPPDSPPGAGVTIKQEVEDEEYEGEGEGGAPADEPRERPVMCKDFVRGTCTRGACNYAHKLDLSQLDGVYRFCRDFENKRCVRPVCHFVHATTFEKEHFRRTGSLPPHATAHLRSPAAAAPPPPPPPQPQPQPQPQPPLQTDLAAELSPLFANAPAAALASAASSLGGGTACAGAGALEARLPLDALAALPTPTAPAPPAPAPAPSPAPLKRDWRDLQACAGAAPPPKKCKLCDITELRLQHSRGQVGSMLRAAQALDEHLAKVDSGNRLLLHAMLKMLAKPRRSLDNVTNTEFLGARLAAPDDPDKEMRLSQMKVLLAKILLGRDALPAEGERSLGS